MEKLVQLLLMLVQKAPFTSESDHDDALDLLRQAAEELGATGVVPPKPGPTNAPPEAPAVEPPGPLAEPVPPAEQAPPPTSPEVAGAAPEATNAFTTQAPGAGAPA